MKNNGSGIVVFVLTTALILMFSTFVYFKYLGRQNMQKFNLQTVNQLSPTPTKSNLNWKTHNSDMFKYSFSYPDNWFFYPYDEENPQIVAGSNTLVNYDMNKVENFMDHGIVDWEKFLGEKLAVKADMSVRNLDKMTQEEFIKQYYSEALLQPESSLSFGELLTKQYDSNDPFTDNTIKTFIAFTNDGRVASASVYFYNQTNQVNVVDTVEWEQLKQIFETFKFD